MFCFLFPAAQHESVINKLKIASPQKQTNTPKSKQARKKRPQNPTQTASTHHPGENTGKDEEMVFFKYVTRNSPEVIQRIKT